MKKLQRTLENMKDIVHLKESVSLGKSDIFTRALRFQFARMLYSRAKEHLFANWRRRILPPAVIAHNVQFDTWALRPYPWRTVNWALRPKVLRALCFGPALVRKFYVSLIVQYFAYTQQFQNSFKNIPSLLKHWNCLRCLHVNLL